MTQPHKLMGFEAPGDGKVPIPIRNWNAMKLALWRSRVGWEIVERQAIEILERCKHLDDCDGATTATEPCIASKFDKDGTETSPGCPDRELRMSALVMLNAARMLMPADARKPANEPYLPPSREFFSEVIAELAVAQAELEVLGHARSDFRAAAEAWIKNRTLIPLPREAAQEESKEAP